MITAKITFAELLEKKPEAAKILFEYGMACCGCYMAANETLKQGCEAHGISKEDVKKIVDKINFIE